MNKHEYVIGKGNRSGLKISCSLFLCFWLIPGVLAYAQRGGITNGEFEHKSFQSKDGKPLLYCLRKPSTFTNGEKYPLLLCLHGRGGRGNDNQKPLEEFKNLRATCSTTKYPCIIVIPQCPLDDQWCAFKVRERPLTGYDNIFKKNPTPVEDRVLQLLASLKQDFPVDPDRIYVTGLSMGGYGSWDLLVREPHLFAAAGPICGDGDQNKVGKIRHIPIWIAHGSKDPIVSVKYSREMNNALRSNRMTIYDEIPNGNHDVWNKTYSNPEFFDWLFSQCRLAGSKVVVVGKLEPKRAGKVVGIVARISQLNKSTNGDSLLVLEQKHVTIKLEIASAISARIPVFERLAVGDEVHLEAELVKSEDDKLSLRMKEPRLVKTRGS